MLLEPQASCQIKQWSSIYTTLCSSSQSHQQTTLLQPLCWWTVISLTNVWRPLLIARFTRLELQRRGCRWMEEPVLNVGCFMWRCLEDCTSMPRIQWHCSHPSNEHCEKGGREVSAQYWIKTKLEFYTVCHIPFACYTGSLTVFVDAIHGFALHCIARHPKRRHIVRIIGLEARLDFKIVWY